MSFNMNLCSIVVMLSILVEHSFALLSSLAVSGGPEIATATHNFIYRLSRDEYFNSSMLQNGDSVRFVASISDHPDLPSWLLYTQSDMLSDGFLYGTPQYPQDSTQLQVVAINLNSHETSQKKINITVNPRAEVAKYLVEVKIMNYNLEEILKGDVLNDFLIQLQQLWNANDLYVTKVVSLRDVEERLPVPSEPGTLLKDGIQVQIGGSTDFSVQMKSAQVEANHKQACSDADSAPLLSQLDKFKPNFVVDWCSYRLITPDMEESFVQTTPKPVPVDLTGDPFDFSTAHIGSRNFQLEFGIIVIFPLVVMLVLLIILGYAMFGRREGVERRDGKTPDTQMSQFNTIRRATTNLRMMLHHRDGPPPLNSTATHTPQPGSEAGTLPRSQPGTLTRSAPPPYRLPLSYPSNSLSRRSAPQSRESTLNRYRGEQDGENEHLVGIAIDDSQHMGIDNA